MTDWDSFVEHTQDTDVITGAPIADTVHALDAYTWAGRRAKCAVTAQYLNCEPLPKYFGRVTCTQCQQVLREDAVEARRTAVGAFLAAQRTTTPDGRPQGATGTQEGQ